MTQPDPSSEGVSPVAAYKHLLKEALDRRPSGMRQRLAKAIGKNRSFVSQISNPAYPTPIPAEHVDRILEVCHFAPEERAAFLKAYRAAHPRRALQAAPPSGSRILTVDVPNFSDAEKNRAFDKAVEDMVARLARLMGDISEESGG